MDPHVFSGNYLQALEALGLPKEIYAQPGDKREVFLDILSRDLPRTPIIGTLEDAERFWKIWNSTTDTTYMQGLVDGRILINPGFLTACLNKPFDGINPLPDQECIDFSMQLKEHTGHFSKAYLDDAGQPSALSVYYNPFNEDQWAVCIIRNTHLPYTERNVFIMTSMEGYHRGPGFVNFPSQNPNTLLGEAFHSVLLREVFQDLIDASGQINTDVIPRDLKEISITDQRLEFRPWYIEPEQLLKPQLNENEPQDPAMPLYHFSGNFKEAVLELGFSYQTLQDVFLEEDEDIERQLKVDESRDGSFIGSTIAYRRFWKEWREASQIDASYCQGNRDGSVFTGKPYFMNWCAGRAPDASPEFDENHDDIKIIRQLYMDDQKNPCGISVVYDKENPSQWMIVIMRNGHLDPENRQVQIFSTVKSLRQTFKADANGISEINKTIAAALDSQMMNAMFSRLISNDGSFNDEKFSVLQSDGFQCTGKRVDPLRVELGEDALQNAGIALNRARGNVVTTMSLEDYKTLTPELHAALYEHIEVLDRDFSDEIPENIRRTIEETLYTLFAIPQNPDVVSDQQKLAAIHAFHDAILALQPYEENNEINRIIAKCSIAVIKMQIQAVHVHAPVHFELLQKNGKPLRHKDLLPEELRLKPRLHAYIHQQLDALHKKAHKFEIKYPHLKDELETTTAHIQENVDTLFAIQKLPMSDRQKDQAEKLMIEECRRTMGDVSDEVKQHRGVKKIFGNIGLAIGLLGVGFVGVGFWRIAHGKSFLPYNPKTDTEEKLEDLKHIMEKELFPVWRKNIGG